jgi:hypothetical protein
MSANHASSQGILDTYYKKKLYTGSGLASIQKMGALLYNVT